MEIINQLTYNILQSMKIEKAKYKVISNLKDIHILPKNNKQFSKFQAFETYVYSYQNQQDNYYQQLFNECKQRIIADYNQQIYEQIKDSLREQQFMIDQAIQIQNNYIDQINTQILFYQSLKNSSISLSQNFKPFKQNQLSHPKYNELSFESSLKNNVQPIQKTIKNEQNVLKHKQKLVMVKTIELYHFEELGLKKDSTLRMNDEKKKQKVNSAYNSYLQLQQAVKYLNFIKQRMKQKKVSRQYYLEEKIKIKFKIQQLKNKITYQQNYNKLLL